MPTYTITALSILLLLLGPSVKAQTSDDQKVKITIPAAPWSLTLNGDDLVVEERSIKSDGSQGYFLIRDDKHKVILSLFIEPALKCKDSKACRDMLWQLGNPAWESPQNIVLSKIDNVSFLEFIVPYYKGTAVQQYNIYAEFVVDEFWVDLHISKQNYRTQEHEFFVQLIKSVKFTLKTKSLAPPK